MHTRISGFACAALLCLTGLPASAEVAGSMAIAGHGPEQQEKYKEELEIICRKRNKK